MNANLQSPKAKFSRRTKAIIAGICFIGFLLTAVLGMAVYDRYSSYEMIYGEEGVMYVNSSSTIEDVALPDNIKEKINYRDSAQIELAADEMIALMNAEVTEGVDSGFPGWINLHILGGQNRKDAAAERIRESHIYGERFWDELTSAAFISQMCTAISEEGEEETIYKDIPQHMKKYFSYVSDISVDDIREYCISTREEYHIEGEPEYVISEKAMAEYSKILKSEQSKYKSNPEAYLAESLQIKE